jgi:hypothetical protein
MRDEIILARGHNRYSLSADVKQIEILLGKTQTWDGISTVHAETHCLSELNLNQKLIKNGTLVIAGISRAGNLIKSRPCPNCMSILSILMVKDVVWRDKDGHFYRETVK